MWDSDLSAGLPVLEWSSFCYGHAVPPAAGQEAALKDRHFRADPKAGPAAGTKINVRRNSRSAWAGSGLLSTEKYFDIQKIMMRTMRSANIALSGIAAFLNFDALF
jgi:hypothetical protein